MANKKEVKPQFVEIPAMSKEDKELSDQLIAEFKKNHAGIDNVDVQKQMPSLYNAMFNTVKNVLNDRIKS